MHHRTRRPAWAIASEMAVLSILAIAGGSSTGMSQTVAANSQTPETLCKCSGNDSSTGGGIRTWEEFKGKYSSRFKSPEEGQWAWRVYQASNRCNAVVVIGRLKDTGGFEGKPGYCVLRTLDPWSMLVNDVFVQGGIDRRARVRFVSEAHYDIMGKEEPFDAVQVEKDRESNWKIIYNHEIAQVLNAGHYGIVGSVDQASPTVPAYLAVKVEGPPCPDLSGHWEGELTVVEVKGSTNIEPGQRRKAAIDAVQGGCSLVVRFNDQEVGGVISAAPLPSGTLSDNPTGALISAEVVGSDPAGRMRLTLAQKLPNGGSVVSSGELTRK